MNWKDRYPKQSNLVKLALEQGGAIKPLILPGEETGNNCSGGVGTGLRNPSVYIDEKEGILVNIRHVGYTMYHTEFDQKYWGMWGCMIYMNPEDFMFLETTNYLCKLDKDLNISQYNKINTNKFDVEPLWDFIGLEDARVFRWDNKLYTCGVRRDLDDIGTGRMELCQVEYWKDGSLNETTRDRIEPPKAAYLEKNWTPILDMPYHFVKWTNPTEIVKVDPHPYQGEIQKPLFAETVIQKNDHFPLDGCDLRGGSQVIPYKDYHICITHECWFPEHDMGNGKDAHYHHRFIFWDKDWNIVKISKKFKFMDTMIEFTCGLAEHGDNLLITFGYQDNGAYILKMPKNVLDLIEYEEL